MRELVDRMAANLGEILWRMRPYYSWVLFLSLSPFLFPIVSSKQMGQSHTMNTFFRVTGQ